MGAVRFTQLEGYAYHKRRHHSSVGCMGINTDQRWNRGMARICPGTGIACSPTQCLRVDDMVGTLRVVYDGLGIVLAPSQAHSTE